MLTYQKEEVQAEAHSFTNADLPPTSGRQSFGIHFAHVAHTNQSDGEILHPLRDRLHRRRHCNKVLQLLECRDASIYIL